MSDAAFPTHGVLLHGAVAAQLVVGAFTQNFYFCGALVLVLKFVALTPVLVPTPVQKNFLVDLVTIFPLLMLYGAFTGILVARAANVPPLLDVSLPWELQARPWRPLSWLRMFFVVAVLLTLLPLIVYDYGVTVWTPGTYWVWGLAMSAILVAVSYPIAYWLLSSYDVQCTAAAATTSPVAIGHSCAAERNARPFRTRRQLRRFLLMVLGVQVWVVNAWWPFNQWWSTLATDLMWPMLAILVSAGAAASLLGSWLRAAHPRSAALDARHERNNYWLARACAPCAE